MEKKAIATGPAPFRFLSLRERRTRMQFHHRSRVAIVLAVAFPLFASVAQARESRAASAQKWFEKGLLMLEARDARSADAFKEAIRDLDAYLDEKGEDRAGLSEAYTLRSKCHSILGDNPRAIEDLDRAIEQSPGDGENYYLRSFVHEIAGNAGMSLDDLKTAARKGHQKARDDLTLKGIQW
jgi:tetratricopeptide (TPR) repeat protein